MLALAAAAILWTGVHVGIAGTALRGAIVRRITERGFMAAFSIASVVSIGLLCAAYNAAPTVILWFAPPVLLWLLLLAMLPACVLFAGAVTTRNPTAVGGDGAPIRGMLLVTRHPMLWSFAIWAAVHILGNGDLASVLFFGAFLVTALAGMPSIDAKIAARNPAAWRALAAATSLIPGARHGFPLGRIGRLPFAVGAPLWAVLFAAHPYVIGVSPLG
jgi:uncharacterized membrane protein